uniref:Uncharacterized protein n=1 Tax=Magallana gigas TaxID=29159 RepID=K1PF03_MAGGI
MSVQCWSNVVLPTTICSQPYNHKPTLFQLNNRVTFNCKKNGFHTFDVSINDTVLLEADYQQGYTKGQFEQCLGIDNNGDGVGKFSIKCTTQHRPVSSIKSSTASFKESSDVLNVKKEEYRTATRCDGTTKSEKHLYVDFSKINHPCSCTVTALFSGNITVMSWKVEHSECNNRVTVNNSVTFNCNDNKHSTFDVGINDSVLLVADFWQGNTSGEFKQCLGVGNHAVLASIATGGIVLAIALVICIIIIMNRMKLRTRTMNFALMLLVKTCMPRCLNKTTAIHLLQYKHRLMMMMDLWMFKIESTAVNQSNSMDDSKSNDRVCYATVKLA